MLRPLWYSMLGGSFLLFFLKIVVDTCLKVNYINIISNKMENKMQLITKEIQKKLDKNFALSKEGKDTKPVLKLFTPWAGATWLISEIEDDSDTMFGLCDLGLGHVELGYISLKELKSLKGPFGLKVERDMYFSSDLTLQEWSEASDTKIAA